MATLEDVWRFAARDLGLDVEVPFQLNLPSGEHLSAAVLLRKFGSAKGMALVRKYESVSSLRAELAECGYGFSVMSDPRPGSGYDRATIIEVVRDWGWTGPHGEYPDWLSESG